jgi:hypothetical protein
MLGLVAPVCKGCSSFIHTAFRMSQNAGWLVLPRCLFHVDHQPDVYLCLVLFLYLFMMMMIIIIVMLVMILQRHKFLVILMMAVSSSSLSPPPSSTSSLSSFSTTRSVLHSDDLT